MAVAGAAFGGTPEDPSLEASESANSDLRLWYTKPAEQWLEALPIGNGRMGAMVFGGIDTERIQLNDDTLWAGAPHVYDNPDGHGALAEIRRLVLEGRYVEAENLVDAKFIGKPARQAAYQPVGDLVLRFAGSGDVTEYRRWLDLDSAVCGTSYRRGGIGFTRTVFSSAPAQAIVLRIATGRPGSLSFEAHFESLQRSGVSSLDFRTIALNGVGGDWEGIAGSVKFTALARVATTGGKVRSENGVIYVDRADFATILVTIGTSYVNYRDVSGDSFARAMEPLKVASVRSYGTLRIHHTRNYRRLFHRVGIDLGRTHAATLPTDERVAASDKRADPALAALHFQFGRYLLLSCSRPGSQPANLQGLWNDRMDPPWQSKYTVNINTEMNYWPAAPANLLECYDPLFSLIADLSVTGRATARTQYGASGWVCHHNTDGWRGCAPVDFAGPGMWPCGGAWLSKSFWDQYQFTGDLPVLRGNYRILRGATEFFLDTLVEHPTYGWLVTCPSGSPEVGHPGPGNRAICAGPTIDNQVLHDLFTSCIDASKLLGTDAAFRTRVAAARERLAPMQIGKAGQLQEWLEDWDVENEDQHNRHVSHLYGLFPSDQITPYGTPDLFAAARKSLEMRGDDATGWSLAWKINLWARLLDGEHAYKLLTDLLSPDRTAPNLFDLHPPFQIDGNFGAVSGICEMLLQSHGGELHLLPALPSAWPRGSVRGLLARTGLEVSISWDHGRLTEATVQSSISNVVRVRCAMNVAVSRIGGDVSQRSISPGLIEFQADAGSRYRLAPTDDP